VVIRKEAVSRDAVARTNFESLDVYRLSENLSDRIWDIVEAWSNFPRDTVGKQLVRAADSIGANIAEGAGKGTFQDNRRYVHVARGSLNETKHWLRRAFKRRLLSSDQTNELKAIVDELSPRLNAYIRSLTTRAKPNISTKLTPSPQRTTNH